MKNNMKSDPYTKAWEKSYLNKDNLSFYPQIDVIRFVAHFIRRRTGFNTFSKEFSTKPIVIDFGCGSGTHVSFLCENGFYPIGIDISAVCLDQTRDLMKNRNFIENTSNCIGYIFFMFKKTR